MSNVRSFASLPHVPIIGTQQVVIHDFRVAVVAQCTCGHGTPFLLTGLMEARKCDACDRVFRIQALAFDAEQAAARVSVSLVPPPVILPPSGARPPTVD